MDRLQHYTQQFSPPLHVQTLNRWQKEENSIRTTRHILQTQSVVRWPEEMTCNLRWHAATVVVLLLLGAAAQRPHTPAVSGRLPPHHSTTAPQQSPPCALLRLSQICWEMIFGLIVCSPHPPGPGQSKQLLATTLLLYSTLPHSIVSILSVSSLTGWRDDGTSFVWAGRAGAGAGKVLDMIRE